MILIRTQSIDQPLEGDGNGKVFIVRNREKGKFRNTSHFTADAIVESHVYGTFEGAVALVANPTEMGRPAGLGQVDTWFHHDDAGRLDIGRAVIVAPEGFVAPEGAKVVTYSGGLEARDEKIREVAAEMGVEHLHGAGFWGWSGQDMSQTQEWRAKTVAEIYGTADGIWLGAHAGSPEERMESVMNYASQLSKTVMTKYSINLDQTDHEVTDILDGAVKEAREILESSGERFPSKYVEWLKETLNGFEKRSVEARKFYEKPFVIDGAAGVSYEELEDLIRLGRVKEETPLMDLRSKSRTAVPAEDIVGDMGAIRRAPPPLPKIVESNQSVLLAGLDGQKGLSERLSRTEEVTKDAEMKQSPKL